MFSRPVSSGWKPVPTSSSEPTRPVTSAQPAVGSVIRERIFSSVLLPAPLWPIRPTTSPCSIVSETSRSAQSVSPSGCSRRRPASRPSEPLGRFDDALAQGAVAAAAEAEVVALAELAGLDRDVAHGSDEVGEAALDAVEVGEAGDEQDERPTRPRRRSAPSGASAVPSTAQRKPSTTPTIGLIAESVRQGSAIRLLG